MTTEREPIERVWIHDPILAALDRSLTREAREEAQEIEAIIADSELRERTFQDVANELRNRGDIVAVGTTRRTFNGRIRYAGKDFVTIRSKSYEADINMAEIAYMRTLRAGENGGTPIEDGPGTFEMRLIERRSPTKQVEVGYRALGETVIGCVPTVGQDHLMVIDVHKQEWIIPLSAVAFVVRRISRNVARSRN